MRDAIEVAIGESRSVRAIAEQFGVSRAAVDRHRRKHRRLERGASIAVLAPGDARREAVRKATHAAVEQMLAGQSLVSEVTQLKKRADSLCIQAEQSNDARTALLAIRELTRLLELQGRLALEAAAGRREEVSSHPLFLRFISILLTELAELPGARERISAILLRELGSAYPGGTTRPTPG